MRIYKGKVVPLLNDQTVGVCRALSGCGDLLRSMMRNISKAVVSGCQATLPTALRVLPSLLPRLSVQLTTAGRLFLSSLRTSQPMKDECHNH